MSIRPGISPRLEAAFPGSLVAVWFALLFAMPHVSLPIPPYRDQPDAVNPAIASGLHFRGRWCRSLIRSVRRKKRTEWHMTE